MTYPFADTCRSSLTTHAQGRIEERKVDPEALNLLVIHSDIRRRSRDGCWRLRLSRLTAKQLDRAAVYPRQTIEHARELEAIVNENERVVTTYKLPPDMRFRRSGARPSRQRLWRRVED